MNRNLIIFALLILTSCTSNTIYEKPKNLIPKDTMINLLTDIYIASSAKYEKNKNLETKVNYMSLVYKKYKIDSIRFSESSIYYTSIIEQYSEILEHVKNTLENQQKIFVDSLKIQDSINSLRLIKKKKGEKEFLDVKIQEKQKDSFLKANKSEKNRPLKLK